MPSKFSIRKLLKRKSEKESQPPPYSGQERPNDNNNENWFAKTANTYTYLRVQGITARSTPQWRWTNAKCRAWIFEVLVKYLGHTHKAACEKAEKFAGFGPFLWSLDCVQWKEYLGAAEGQSVFTLLVSMCKEMGTIPKGGRLPNVPEAYY